MKNISPCICTIILTVIVVLAFLPFFKGLQVLTNKDIPAKEKVRSSVWSEGLSNLKAVQEANEPVKRICNCFRCRYSMPADGPVSDLWERGEFITLRKAYPHGRCGGQMVFNGKATPAPYSEKEYFYTHVCDKCSETNQILNATWPQYKQEWRSL